MSFFITSIEGEYALTTAGYVAVAVIIAALIVIAAAVSKKSEGKKMGTRQLVFCAMAIALATVTSMVRIYRFPFGGSVTLCSMLFICLIGYMYGPATGILTGMAYGVLQFFVEPYILLPAQVVLDYVLAFGALGLSGFFWKSKNGLIKGYLLGIIGRYMFVVLSGCLFFGEYAWEGWAVLPYSLVYNGTYIFTEGVLTVIILLIPAVAKSIGQVKTMIVH